MNRKIVGFIVGAIIGGFLLGLCSSFIGGNWRTMGIIVGVLVGGFGGVIIVVGQSQMLKDRETGLDG